MTAPALTAGSPQTQHLIDLCLSLEQHPEKMAELVESAQVRLDDMHRAEDTFFAGVDAQGAEFYQRHRDSIDKVEEQFRAYGDALESLVEGGFTPLKVARALAAASRGLRVTMALYEEAYLSEGPSRYPVVNLFENVVNGVASGTIGRSLLEATCSRYIAFYSGAIAEIEASHSADHPGVPQRKQALGTIIEGISELSQASNSDGLEAVLGRMTAAHADLDSAFDTYHRHEFSVGPAQGEKINWLVNAAQGVLAGTYQPKVLEAMAQGLLDVTQHNLAEMKNLRRNKLEDALLSEELDRMIEAVEDIEDALVFLIDYSHGTVKDAEEVLEAIDDLVESGDALLESSQIVNEAQESAGKVTCVKCQALQDKGARSCVRCGALLPQQPDEGVYGNAHSSFQVLEGADPADLDQDEVMTDVAHALFEACEAFIQGRMPADALVARVEQNQRTAEQALNRLDRLRTPAIPPEVTDEEHEAAEQFVGLAEDALMLLSQGAAECAKGLTAIAQAAKVDDLEALRAGMRLYYEGTQKMWQVRRLDRQLDNYFTPLPSDTTQADA